MLCNPSCGSRKNLRGSPTHFLDFFDRCANPFSLHPLRGAPKRSPRRSPSLGFIPIFAQKNNGHQMAGRHKEVIYVGYGVTLKMGLHRFPILCYIAEFLRVFPYFFHHSKDFFFGRNIYHSGSGKINIHLYIAMTA